MVLDLTLLSHIIDQNWAAYIVILQSYKEIETIGRQRATLLLQISREIIFTIKCSFMTAVNVTSAHC